MALGSIKFRGIGLGTSGVLFAGILVGRIGRQVWHMPVNTNLAFREVGIALFFAAVGLNAGAKFFETVFSTTGLQWLVAGAAVTVVPLLLVGSMTDPPALAFASNTAGSDAPTVAYATVFPLTTLMRILSAQILAIVLFQ